MPVYGASGKAFVQCPAVRSTVGDSNVPLHLNAGCPPTSINNSTTAGCALPSTFPSVTACVRTRINANTATNVSNTVRRIVFPLEHPCVTDLHAGVMDVLA